jgi:hypothetical protein
MINSNSNFSNLTEVLSIRQNSRSVVQIGAMAIVVASERHIPQLPSRLARDDM